MAVAASRAAISKVTFGTSARMIRGRQNKRAQSLLSPRRHAPRLLQFAKPFVRELGCQIRMEQSAMWPEVAANVCQIPPADGFVFGLAIDKRVNRFEPIGLCLFAPRPMPTWRRRLRPHAREIGPVGRRR